MKTQEFRKLIREEVRKALKEGAGFDSNNHNRDRKSDANAALS